MVADATFRRSVLAFRWLLVVLWVALIQTGVLDVSEPALITSTIILVAYNAYHTFAEWHISRTGKLSQRAQTIVRYVDILTITVAMVALHDERNPVWAIYFVSIVGAANFITPKEMAIYCLWIIANFLAFGGISEGLGHDMSWSYIAVVCIAMALMGLNAAIIAGGEDRLREVIRQAAITDSLTGLPNRHHFHEQYSDSLEDASATKKSLAVMLIDVDHFKEINDNHGHPAGDDKLRDIAAAMKSVMRDDDMVARYGGDEFIAIAHGAERPVAIKLAERLRDAARECGASVSIGVAVCPQDGETEVALIEAADAALYRAKEDGRNCVRTLGQAA
jgi:diguanylate cyclase (GGDEF)-like protein